MLVGPLTLNSQEHHKLNKKLQVSQPLEMMCALPRDPGHSILSYQFQNGGPVLYFVRSLVLHYSIEIYAEYTYNLKYLSSHSIYKEK